VLLAPTSRCVLGCGSGWLSCFLFVPLRSCLLVVALRAALSKAVPHEQTKHGSSALLGPTSPFPLCWSRKPPLIAGCQVRAPTKTALIAVLCCVFVVDCASFGVVGVQDCLPTCHEELLVFWWRVHLSLAWMVCTTHPARTSMDVQCGSLKHDNSTGVVSC
jgi:hypothetical protein